MEVHTDNIDVIIFSCDRALQLEAVLHSFYLHCINANNANIYVLYLATDARHDHQYKSLIANYPGITFILQKNFRQNLLTLTNPYKEISFRKFIYLAICLIGNMGCSKGSWLSYIWELTGGKAERGLIRTFLPALLDNKYIVFLVDDNIFVRDFNLRDCVVVLDKCRELLGFSLRLGENTTFCYPLNSPQELPEFTKLCDDLVKFDWTNSEYDFGYPLEVSSSIFRIEEIVPFMMALRFNNPNTLEEQMASHTSLFRSRFPYLGCFRRSVTFCNPINKVQTIIPNRAGEVVYYGIDELATRFEHGERIKVDAYNDFVPNGCHQEVEFIFERVNEKR